MRAAIPDRRLVPGAVLGWAAAIVGLRGPLPPAAWLAVGLGAALVTALAVAIAPRIGRRISGSIARRFDTRRAWRIPMGAVLVAVACTTLIGAAAAAHAERTGDGPVPRAAEARTAVTAIVDVTGDPRRRAGGVRGIERRADSWEVPARLRGFTTTGGSTGEVWRVDVPLLMRIDTPEESIGATRPDALPAPALPPRGSRIVVDGRLGPVEWTPEYAAVLAIEDEPRVVSEPGALDTVITAMRGGLQESLSGVPPDAAALVAGLAIGDESAQPEDLAEAMRVSGLSHLTAVSGGNIALVVGAVFLLARLLGLSVRLRVASAALALLGYVLLVGPEPSVLRAAAMGSVALLAVGSGNARRGLSALCAAVIVLLLLAPTLAVSLGFALSAAATAGLIVVAPGIRAALLSGDHPPRWARRWPRLRIALVEAVTLTAAAQVATAPLIGALGEGLSVVAVPANVLAAPAVAPVTVLGLLAALCSPVLPPLGTVLGYLAAPGAAWIALVSRTAANLPIATLPWPGGLAGAALAGVLGGAITVAIRGRRRLVARLGGPATRVLGALVVAGLALLVLRPPQAAGWPPPGWLVVACDVGQGDALVVPTGPGSAVVVDAGPDPGDVDRCLDDLGIHEVTAVVLTHFHADHVEGLPGVLRDRDVGAILTSPVRDPADQAERVQRWAAERGIETAILTAGEQRTLAPGVSWTVRWPARIIPVESIPNNASVVLDIDVHGHRVLLLGDIEPVAQVAVRAVVPPGVDVVKVAHHGSIHQDPRFAAWAGARIAVVSVGAGNGYGHPAPETIAAWEAAGSLVRRTDRHGDIAVVAGPGIVTRR